ncbi:MAG: glycosyltransferase [Pseudomonadota bacterium]
MSGSDPLVSIIIPVYNGERTIRACLESLVRQCGPGFEIIVVDDGSVDVTVELCRSFPQVRIIEPGRGGPSRARNIGIKAARGEFIAFTDGDCTADEAWLAELVAGFEDDRTAGVGGDQKSPDDETDTGRLIQSFMKTIGFITDYIKTDADFKETPHNPSCCVMYRKSVLEEVGGFDETLFPGEDVDLDARLIRRGYRLIYNPRACVSHYRPQTYAAFARMMERYGACQWPLIMKYGFFRKIHYEPPVLMLSALTLLAFILMVPAAWPIALTPLAAVFLWFLGRTGSAVGGSRFTLLMLITVVSWNWGFFSAAVRGYSVTFK